MYQQETGVTRITNQREAIVNFLEKNRIHPTASQVYEHVRSVLPRISRMTVYRNLDKLSEQKIVRKVFASGVTRFEIMDGHEEHDHFVCKKCGTIIDLHQTKRRAKLLEEFKQEYPDVEVDGTMLSISGTCKSCLKRR